MKFTDIVKKIFPSRKRKASATTSIIIEGSGGTVWTPQDYENFARETYLKNVISYRCIDIIAKSVASVPWQIKRRLPNGEAVAVNAHYLNSIFQRPNPDKSWASLMVESICYLLISGNIFIEKVSTSGGPNRGKVQEVYSLRPDRMKILTNPYTGRLAGYEYTVNNKSVVWKKDPITGECDIIHIKSFHPTDDFWGASVTEPASREIDTSNEATRWNKRLLENEGRPGLVFTVGGYLTDEQYDRLEKRLQEDVSGSSNARRNLIVEGEKASVLPYGWNPAELDFLEGSRELNRRIAFAYGVPPMLVGIPGDNTFSNYKEARMAFWEDTIIYYLNLIRGEFSSGLFFSETDLFLDYDLNNIPALAPKREKMWEMSERSDFLSLNEKRKLSGFEEDSRCDVILINDTMMPIEMAGAKILAEMEAMQNEDNGNSGQDSEGDDQSGEEQEDDMEGDDQDPKKALDWKKVARKTEPTEEKPLPNEFSCRLSDPEQYSSFRRKNGAASVDGKRVDFIYGIKGKKAEIQAIRYPISDWSKEQAREHCNQRKHILFE